MDSEIFEKLPPTKLFFRCAIPSMISGEPLGHIDENTDNYCDRCKWRMDAHLETVKTHFSDVKDTDKVNDAAGTTTFNGIEFNVVDGAESAE